MIGTIPNLAGMPVAELSNDLPRMFGTMLNVAGILIGGLVGLRRHRPLSPATESYFKVVLSALTVFYGLRLTWASLNGSFFQLCKQLLVVVLALMLGKLVGHLLHLQAASNRIGLAAREQLAAARPGRPENANEGFRTCAALFCAAPLGILGAVQDGLSGYFYPLAVKAVIDGLAAMGFVSFFGSAVLLSVVPVLAFQGTITLMCARFLQPFLDAHGLIQPVNAAGGLLVFSVALVMLGLKRIELADYLPSLVFAGLFAWLAQ